MPGLAKEPQLQTLPTNPAPPRTPSSHDDRTAQSAPIPAPAPSTSVDLPCSPRHNLIPRRPELLAISASATLPAGPEPGGCLDAAERPAPSLIPQPPAVGSPGSSGGSPRARSFSSRTVRSRQPLILTSCSVSSGPPVRTGALQDSATGVREGTTPLCPPAPTSTVNAASSWAQDPAPNVTSASGTVAVIAAGAASTPAVAGNTAGCPASAFEPLRPPSTQRPPAGVAAPAASGAGTDGRRSSVDFARNATSGAAAALRALEAVTAAAESWDALRAHHLVAHSSTSEDSDGGDVGDARQALAMRRPLYGPRGMSRSSSGIASTEPNAWILRTGQSEPSTAIPPGHAKSTSGVLLGAEVVGKAATQDDGSRTIGVSDKVADVSGDVISGPPAAHTTLPAAATATTAQSANSVASRPQPASDLHGAEKSGSSGVLTLRPPMISLPQHRSGQRTELRLGSESGGSGGGGSGGLWGDRRETRRVADAGLGFQGASEDGSFTALLTMASRQHSGSFSSPSSPSLGSSQLRRQQAVRGHSRSGLVTWASLLEPGTPPSRQQSSHSDGGASRKDTGGDDDGDARRQGTSIASLEEAQEGAQQAATAAATAASILDTARLLADAAERRRLSYDGLSRHASKYGSNGANADSERGGATAAPATTPVIAAAADTAVPIADAPVPASLSTVGQPRPAPLQLPPGDAKPSVAGRGTSDTATAGTHAAGSGDGSNSVSSASSPAAHSKAPLITALAFERAPWSGHSSGPATLSPSYNHPLPHGTGSGAVGGLLLPPSPSTTGGGTGTVANKHPPTFASFRSAAPGLIPPPPLSLPAAESMQPTASPRAHAPVAADTNQTIPTAGPTATHLTTASLAVTTSSSLDQHHRNSLSTRPSLPFSSQNTPLSSAPSPRAPNAGRHLSAGATFSTTTTSSSYAPAAAAGVSGTSPPRSSLALRNISSLATSRSLRGGAPSSSFLERLGTSSGTNSGATGGQQAAHASAAATVNTLNSVSAGGGSSSASSGGDGTGFINTAAGSRVPVHSRRTMSGLVEPALTAHERAKSISGNSSSGGEGSYWRREGSCSLDGSGLETNGGGGYGRSRRRATEDGTAPDDGLMPTQGGRSSKDRATAEDCVPAPVGDGTTGAGSYGMRHGAKHVLLRYAVGPQMAWSEAIMEDGGEGGDAAREDDTSAQTLPPLPPRQQRPAQKLVEKGGREVEVEKEGKEDVFASWAGEVGARADLHHTC